jgi:hypothetical protein
MGVTNLSLIKVEYTNYRLNKKDYYIMGDETTKRILIPKEINEYLDYDPVLGTLTWKKAVGSSGIGFTIQGHNDQGYQTVGFKKKRYQAHRLAWFLMTGEQPPDVIDHINGNTSDNTWKNLRESNLRDNRYNSEDMRTCKGVTFVKSRGKYKASMRLDGRRLQRYFNTEEEALEAYQKLRKGELT